MRPPRLQRPGHAASEGYLRFKPRTPRCPFSFHCSGRGPQPAALPTPREPRSCWLAVPGPLGFSGCRGMRGGAFLTPTPQTRGEPKSRRTVHQKNNGSGQEVLESCLHPGLGGRCRKPGTEAWGRAGEGLLCPVGRARLRLREEQWLSPGGRGSGWEWEEAACAGPVCFRQTHVAFCSFRKALS